VSALSVYIVGRTISDDLEKSITACIQPEASNSHEEHINAAMQLFSLQIRQIA